MTTEPGIYDFVIYQRPTFNRVIAWFDETGSLVNLTGYTARMMARVNISDAVPFIWMSTDNGGITLGGSAGTITLFMSPATTAAITATTGFYDLELTDASGNVTRLLEGTITISDQVTR